MSSTYLYSDNDAIYDMSVSSTGTVLSYTDITTQVPLPSTEANANKYLKVRNDGKNLEWAEMELAGGLELILDERTTNNPPSICFEDTSGTKYNTGINMYRDTSNANEETISFYSDNSIKMNIAETSTSVSNIFKINSGTQFNSQTITIADHPFTILPTTPSLLNVDGSSGAVGSGITLRLQDMVVGQKICVLKTSITGSYTVVGSTIALNIYTPVGNLTLANSALGLLGSSFRGYFEILRLSSTDIIVYNFVAYNTSGATVFPGSVNLGDTSADTTVSTGLLRVQNETAQAIQFGTSGTYLGQNALNGFIVQQAGLNTATVANSNSYFYCPVNIGTSGDNKNLIVNGNVEANRYRAGNGTVGQPSFSFTTASGNDTGLYYQPAGDNVDRLVITVGNSGKFTIRETIAPAVRGITTHINDLIQEGDLNVTGGATNLTGGNVTIGTSGGTTRNLNVNGDLTVSGTIIGAGVGTNNITLTGTTIVDGPINITGGDLQVGTSGINRNFNLFGQLNVDGSCLLRGVRNTYGLVSGTNQIHTVSLTGTSYHLEIHRGEGVNTQTKTIRFTDLGTAGLGFEFYFYGHLGTLINPVIIENKSGTSLIFYDSGYVELLNDGVHTLMAGDLVDYDLFHAHYRISTGTTRRWILRRIKQS